MGKIKMIKTANGSFLKWFFSNVEWRKIKNHKPAE